MLGLVRALVRAVLLGRPAAVAQALVLVLVQPGVRVLLQRRARPALPGLVPQGPRLPRSNWDFPSSAELCHFQLNDTGERVFHRFTKALPVDALRFHT